MKSFRVCYRARLWDIQPAHEIQKSPGPFPLWDHPLFHPGCLSHTFPASSRWSGSLPCSRLSLRAFDQHMALSKFHRPLQSDQSLWPLFKCWSLRLIGAGQPLDVTPDHESTLVTQLQFVVSSVDKIWSTKPISWGTFGGEGTLLKMEHGLSGLISGTKDWNCLFFILGCGQVTKLLQISIFLCYMDAMFLHSCLRWLF